MRGLIRFTLFLFCRSRCFVRRHHAGQRHLGRAPVKTHRGGHKRAVELAAKVVCSQCGKQLDVQTSRPWRRAAGLR